MKPFYRHLIIDSWSIARKNYFLWPLALLTSFVGIAGTFQVFFDLSGSAANGFFAETDFLTSVFVTWSAAFEQIPWLQLTFSDIPFIFFFFFLLFIILTITVATISSEGGLIYATKKLLKKEKTNYLASFRHGLDKFWYIFIISILYRLLYLVLLGLLIIPLATTLIQTDVGGRMLLALFVYLVLVPLVIVLDLVTRYSIMYIVLKNNEVLESFKNAWLLFRVNWIISIEAALLILTSLIAAFLLLSVIILPVLSIFFTFFGAVLSFSELTLQLALIATIIIIVLIVALFVTLFTAFQTSIWVGIFSRLTSGQKHHSKVHRLTRHVSWLHRKTSK